MKKKKYKNSKKAKRRALDRKTHDSLKTLAYEMADGMCQSPISDTHICKGKPFLPYHAAHLDHIIPVSLGGTDDLSNLRILCDICHALRAGKEHYQLRQEMKASGKLPRGFYDYIWEN